MARFLSEVNINRLIFMLRDIFPENKWDELSETTRPKAIRWFRTTDPIVDNIGGLPALNQRFIDHIVEMEGYYQVQDNSYGDPHLESQDAWYKRDQVSFMPNFLHQIDSNDFNKKHIKRNISAQNGTTATQLDEVTIGNLKVKEFMNEEQQQAIKHDLFRGRLKNKKYINRNNYQKTEVLRVCEEDVMDNMPRSRYELTPNNTTGDTYADKFNVARRYTKQFDIHGRPFMYDNKTRKDAAVYGIRIAKQPSIAACSKSSACRSYRTYTPDEIFHTQEYADNNKDKFNDDLTVKNKKFLFDDMNKSNYNYPANTNGSYLGQDYSEYDRLEQLFNMYGSSGYPSTNTKQQQKPSYNSQTDYTTVDGSRAGKALANMFFGSMPLNRRGDNLNPKYNPNNIPKYLTHDLKNYAQTAGQTNFKQYKEELYNRMKDDYINGDPIAYIVPSFDDYRNVKKYRDYTNGEAYV